MNTIYDLGMAIEEIRSYANVIEVRGSNNIEAVHKIFILCNEIIQVLNEIVENNSNVNSVSQEGDGDGQVDS